LKGTGAFGKRKTGIYYFRYIQLAFDVYISIYDYLPGDLQRPFWKFSDPFKG